MQVFRVILASDVWTELGVIRDTIAADSPENAARFVGKLLGTMYALRDEPTGYTRVTRLRTSGFPIHKVVERPYVIYYAIEEPTATVRVLRIRHAARRQPWRFE